MTMIFLMTAAGHRQTIFPTTTASCPKMKWEDGPENQNGQASIPEKEHFGYIAGNGNADDDNDLHHFERAGG